MGTEVRKMGSLSFIIVAVLYPYYSACCTNQSFHSLVPIWSVSIPTTCLSATCFWKCKDEIWNNACLFFYIFSPSVFSGRCSSGKCWGMMLLCGTFSAAGFRHPGNFWCYEWWLMTTKFSSINDPIFLYPVFILLLETFHCKREDFTMLASKALLNTFSKGC